MTAGNVWQAIALGVFVGSIAGDMFKALVAACLSFTGQAIMERNIRKQVRAEEKARKRSGGFK